jgi:hypothetical protein
MNAIELFHQDGKSAKVFYCEKCRIVAKTQEQAEQCCRPLKCDMCGNDTERYYFRCRECRDKEDAQRERDRFEKAEKLKLTEWDGPVFSDSVAGSNDGFFTSISELLERCADEIEAGEDDSGMANIPDYVWASKSNQFVNADLGDITERISCDAYKDFNPADLHGLDDLKKALAAFNDANKHFVSYEPDYTKAILIKKPATNS